MHRCLQCGKVYKYDRGLQQHISIKHVSKQYYCEICSYQCTDEAKLNNHISNVHKIPRIYTCNDCGYNSTHLNHYKRHLEVHSQNKNIYKCDSCNREYQYQTSLTRHKNSSSSCSGKTDLTVSSEVECYSNCEGIMEVDTEAAVTPSSEKLCNGKVTENGDGENISTNSKVKSSLKSSQVNGHVSPMEEESVKGRDEENMEAENGHSSDDNKENHKEKVENGDTNSDELNETKDNDKSLNGVNSESDEAKDDDAMDVQNISDSSDAKEIEAPSEEKESKEENEEDENENEEDKKEEEGDKNENEVGKKEEEEDKDEEEVKENAEKEKDDKSVDDKDKDSESAEKSESIKAKDKDQDKATDKDKDKAKDSAVSKKASETEKDKKSAGKDGGADAVDLTEEKTSSSTPSKPSRVATALKPSAASTQMRPMASLLFDVGMDLARQQVYKDLIRIQMKKQSMDKLDEKETRQLDKLKEAYDDLVAKNDPFALSSVKCNKCEFKADLGSVLENHQEYGHTNSVGTIQCHYCDEQFKVSNQFMQHMDQKHKRKGRVVVRHSFFVCPYCPFEHNSKASFNKHILRCERVFNLARNLEPTPADCDIPIKLPKPPVVQPVKTKPNTIAAAAAAAAMRKAPQPQPIRPVKPSKPGGNAAAMTAAQAIRMAQQQQQNRASVTIAPPPAGAAAQGAQMIQVGNQWYQMINLNGQRFLTPMPTGPVNTPASAHMSPNIQHPTPKGLKQGNSSPASLKISKAKESSNQAKANKAGDKPGTFEICEICGGFVKDRDSLRIHFYWAHKVDIQKELFNKKNPNIQCEKCNFRCWTVQGLTRHKGMAHKDSLKNKDKVRTPFYCILCRPTPELLHTETFWLHMAAKHSIGPDTIYSYPHCVVCGVPNIGVPRALETHMLNIHNHLFSVDLLELARKLVASKPSSASPHVVKAGPKFRQITQAQNQASSKLAACDHCEMRFAQRRDLDLHIQTMHSFKCSRCPRRMDSRELLMKHFHDTHKDEKEKCPLCKEVITIGRPLVRHMRSSHMKQCSVVIQKLPQKEVDKRMDKYVEMFGPSGSILRTPQKSGRKRNRSSVADISSVIVLDETPTKKSRTSATRKAVSEARSKAGMKSLAIKDVIEVDGEEIVVEVQQDEDDDDEEEEAAAAAPAEKATVEEATVEEATVEEATSAEDKSADTSKEQDPDTSSSSMEKNEEDKQEDTEEGKEADKEEEMDTEQVDNKD